MAFYLVVKTKDKGDRGLPVTFRQNLNPFVAMSCVGGYERMIA